MRRLLRVLQALVMGRKAILVVLGLFYVASAFMVAVARPAARGSILGLLWIIPTAGFFAMATERVMKYANAGGLLGIPDHAAAIRQGQLAFASLFLVTPIVVGAYLGGVFSWLSMLCVAAALGTLLAQYPQWAFMAWVTGAVGARVISRLRMDWSGLYGTAIRVALIVGSLVILARWLRLASQMHDRARFAFSGLADRKHERAAEIAARTRPDDNAKTIHRLARHEAVVDSVVDEVVRHGVTPAVLSAILAVDVQRAWMRTARLVVIGWIVLAVAGLMFGAESEQSVFSVITAVAVVWVLSNAHMVYRAWKNRGPEECLMVLTPRWPAPRAIKRVFVQLILAGQGVALLTWSAIVMPFAAAGWIARTPVAFSALWLVALSAAASGAMGLALSQRRTTNWPFGIAGILLCGFVGAAVVAWTPHRVSPAGAIGIAMILAPPVIGFVSLWWRPLQFPVQRSDVA